MYEEDHINPDFGKPPRNPFKTPENYFESLEDRIMGNINVHTKKENSAGKIIRFLKPALGIAASLILILMLGYYSVNTFLLNDTDQTALSDTASSDPLNNYSISITSIDENSLINAIFTDETNVFAETNPDEFLAYISTGLDEIEIYSEIQN